MITKYRSTCVIRKKRKRLPKSSLFFCCSFPAYRQVQAYIRELAYRYPGSIQVETIGFTYLGRQLDMIIIRKDINVIKNAVLIDGGIHAREWIAVTSVLYIISRIVKYPEILDLMDFYIIPILNPDGYIYSHTTNRLWRKNLNQNFSKDSKEWGVDLNRNFPFGYGRDSRGSSKEKNSLKYRGIRALSEMESQALANVMDKYGEFIKLYISFHAYGNSIMYPWGYTKRNIHDYELLDKCAHAAKDLMYPCRNKEFKVGSVANTLYLTSGSSTDFAKGCHKIKFVYVVELERYGKSGFTPSVFNILEIGRESMKCVEAMTKFVYDYYTKCPRHG